MIQLLYIDGTIDGTNDVIKLPKRARKLRIGSEVKIDDEPYEVWYIEDVGTTHRNVRVEKKA